MVAREHVATAAIILTTALFLLISLSSYAVFGPGSQSGARLAVPGTCCACLEKGLSPQACACSSVCPARPCSARAANLVSG